MTPAKHVAVIGAGPCGLMAAETLASSGFAVTVYDRMPTPARKLLIAGRGGLNLTHSEPLDIFLTRYGSAADWLAPSIRAFTPEMLQQWCEGLGQQIFVGSSGRVFPRSMKAVPLLRAWLERLEKLGVQYAPRHRWLGFDGKALRFENAAGKSVAVTPDAALLALGGASWPRLGSDGGWVDILKAAGVEIAPLRATNCGFIVPWSEHMTRFAGSPLKPVSITHDGASKQGEAMITEKGIEGGVIYALSASIREAIAKNGKASLKLDLRPGMSAEALTHKLQAPRGSKSLSTYLQKAGLSPLLIALLREVTPPELLAQSSPSVLAARLKALPLTLTAPAGLARAISTAGGITRHAVDEHFMLRSKPGIFAAGEMLDWEAPTGGYLLQACFSTGVAAAKGIMEYCASGV